MIRLFSALSLLGAMCNTDVASKRDPHRTTRAVDNDLRDTIVREFWTGAGR
jgi:hypothetical protein